jgi:hypothetical protein
MDTEEGEHDRVAWFWIIAVALAIGFAIGGFVTWATYRSEIHDQDYKCTTTTSEVHCEPK